MFWGEKGLTIYVIMQIVAGRNTVFWEYVSAARRIEESINYSGRLLFAHVAKLRTLNPLLPGIPNNGDLSDITADFTKGSMD